MTWWMVLAGWALGWLVAVRPSMRRTMLKTVCSECDSGEFFCEHEQKRQYYKKVVRGARFDRDGIHVAWSVWFAAWWPFWLAYAILAKLLRLLGAGVTTAVVRATPLTQPELERRLAEQQREIDRLTAEIGGKS